VIWLANLSPAQGAEIQKARPCLVVSVDSVGSLPLKVVVPVTEWQPSFNAHAWHVKLKPTNQNGLSKSSSADCLQIRCISEDRFIRKFGQVDAELLADVIAAIGIITGI
jgi:mRNA interferase MazF